MQYSPIQGYPYIGLKSCITGHVSQVRNHVKMYPWRTNRKAAECYLDTTKTPYTDKHNINEFRPSKFKKKPWMHVIFKDRDERFNRYRWHEAYTSDPHQAKETASSRMKRLTDSIRDRGHPRERKSYDPPEDVRKRIIAIYNDLQSSTKPQNETSHLSEKTEESIMNVVLNSSNDFKYDMILRCMSTFGHEISSATLNDLNTIFDLVDYYSTPVQGIDPYSALVNKSDSLPTNLTIISEALRFDKDTDQYFGGYNAMPGLISQVPGLRGSKKYQTLNQDEFQWPDV